MTLPFPSRAAECGWSAADVAHLRGAYAAAPRAELLARLAPRSWTAIQAAARRLGLARPSPRRWSAADLQLLRQHYPAHGGDYVAARVGRARACVQKMAAKLGVAGRQRWRAVPAASSAGGPAAAKAPAKRLAGAPNLLAQKSRRQGANVVAKAAAPPAVPVTADYIRRLPVHHPERRAYTQGGAAGWLAWKGGAGA